MDRRQKVKPPEPDRKRAGERGQTLVEYALIILLISLAAIPAFYALVPAAGSLVQTIVDTLST
jgi:Flp pilus assembly pilin Flp